MNRVSSVNFGMDNQENEYELQDVRENLESSVATRLSHFVREFGLDRNRLLRSQDSGIVFARFWHSVIIPRKSRLYKLWVYVILACAAYSSFFTPIEFGFFRGLPKHLWWIDQATQIMFMVDIVINFFVAYKDRETYNWVLDHHSIALRYAKSNFVPDVLCCLPWDSIYTGTGRREIVRYLLWIRLYRVRKVTSFFHKLEKNIRLNYLFTRIVKLILVELYCTHTAACIFYYLATTLPASREKFTWIGSLTLGAYDFDNFRQIDLGRRYCVSLYFAIVTMATVGYGDVHAVNPREMVFVMVFVSFDMILGAYLIGNMTALIVKGSNTEKFRDKMTSSVKYMNRNKLGRDLRSQMKNHLRLQYESQFIEEGVVEGLPFSLRAKVTQSLYLSSIERVLLFRSCSPEFISQVATNIHEEYFLPGDIIMEQGMAVDQIYFVTRGTLDEIVVSFDGSEEIIAQLEPDSSFGDIAVLCNIPQPYTVRATELCKVLRIDKQTFVSIMQIFFVDGKQVLNNLVKFKDSESKKRQLESDIAFLISEQEAELSLKVNNAAYHGNLSRLKSLVKAGADPKMADYDGRCPLHLAAAGGYEEIVLFLIQEGADVNFEDIFGNTPLIEAVKGGHDHVAGILRDSGAKLSQQNAGFHLRNAVLNGNLELVKHLLVNGTEPNSPDHCGRTALHYASSEGLTLISKVLIEHGADIHAKDRWEKTPIDEGTQFGARLFLDLFQDAMVIHEAATEGELDSNAQNNSGVKLTQKMPDEEEPKGNMESIAVAKSNSQTQSRADFKEEDFTLTFLEGEDTTSGEKILGHSQNDSSQILDAVIFESISALSERADARNSSVMKDYKKKQCTVFACPPWTPANERKYGVVLLVPENIDTLLHMGSQHFGHTYNLLLNEDAGEILSTDFIRDRDKVFIIEKH